MIINTSELKWTRAPKQYTITEDKVEMITEPHTDLWQRTYYHFRNDNAPVCQMETDEKYFSFVVKTEWGCGRNPGPNEVINRRRSRTCIPTKND